MTPQRILFATMPMDGHFNPLTGIAVHLSNLGHDIRWYVGGHYGEKVAKLGLHHYPYKKAKTVNQENLDSLFPERKSIKGAVARIRFDIKQVFLHQIPEFVDDLRDIYQSWPYDIIIHDVAFLSGAFIQNDFPVKTVAVGVIPLAESDDNLPAPGLGQHPATSLMNKWVQRLMSHVVQHIMFKPCNELYNQLRRRYGLKPTTEFVFDTAVHTPDLYLQSGVPSFEYPRKHISPNIRFVGPLLPFSPAKKPAFEQAAKALIYSRVVLVTQGTAERDVEKILVPTLEAFKNDASTLVIATTGGSQADELRDRFPQENVIIEDFIDFNAVMPYANIYVTNGGYGGVMLSLKHNLPIVAAGIHEGKNEIAARIDYCKVGIDLKTETPKPSLIRRAVERVLTDPSYLQHTRKMSREFSTYKPNVLVEEYIDALVTQQAETGYPLSSLIK